VVLTGKPKKQEKGKMLHPNLTIVATVASIRFVYVFTAACFSGKHP